MYIENPRQKTERLLLTVPRLFAVKIEGIWRLLWGTYQKPLKSPFTIRVILNGLYIKKNNPLDYMDLVRSTEEEAENCVINMNFSTLPKIKKSKKIVSQTISSFILREPRTVAPDDIQIGYYIPPATADHNNNATP